MEGRLLRVSNLIRPCGVDFNMTVTSFTSNDKKQQIRGIKYIKIIQNQIFGWNFFGEYRIIVYCVCGG